MHTVKLHDSNCKKCQSSAQWRIQKDDWSINLLDGKLLQFNRVFGQKINKNQPATTSKIFHKKN